MIVPGTILLALCWFVLSVAGAAAESCDPAAIIDAYRQAEASYQAQDFVAAAAQFRPLAEQGLGPAQLRLGEIVQTGDKPDLMQAYRWIALATDVHAPGAPAALIELTKRIGPAQIALEHFTPATWRPAQLWSCLAGDPHITRPDGTSDYAFDQVINRRLLATPTTAQGHRDWLAMSLETILTKTPRYRIYLKALNGIGFVSNSAGPFLIPTKRDDLPFVLVNQSYMGTVSAKEPAQLLTAVTTTVHAALVPEAFNDGKTRTPVTETYKGYTIRTINDKAGQGFLRFAKIAIDMTDRLPPDLLKLARAMTDIRLEQHLPGDGRAGTVAFGTLQRDPKTGQAYMRFDDNLRGRGPGWMVVTLVGGGVYLRRGAGQMAGGSDGQHGDCELDAIEKRTMEALQLSPTDLGRANNSRTRRGC